MHHKQSAFCPDLFPGKLLMIIIPIIPNKRIMHAVIILNKLSIIVILIKNYFHFHATKFIIQCFIHLTVG